MPVVRIELPSTREEASKILTLYQKGFKHRQSEDVAIDEVWSQGHTPTGDIKFAGITNGQPPRLKYDVTIYPNLTRPE